jgi:hypothetical protein
MTWARQRPMRRTAPLRRSPFDPRKARMRRTALAKAGRKTRENARALRVFKKDCAKYGIDRCERRGPHCTGMENLTWAHGRKRRELLGGELERFAIVCCVNCHRELDEQMTHEEMAAEVDRLIQLRPERYLEAA